ncbi:thioredoxin family protein [bacterium]|nr:thioredoxin family protein [bacterium]
MAFISEKDRNYLRDVFTRELVNNVRLVFFTQKLGLFVPGVECEYCRETGELLKELSETSDKIKLEVYDFISDEEMVKRYGIERIPAIVIAGEEDYGIRFYGIPSGYEFSSLIETIIDVSKRETKLSKEVKERLARIDKDVVIQVFVTPTCPYCPRMIHTAYQFALENKYITAKGIEVIEFPQLGNYYNVSGVPKTVINDKEEIVGAVPESVFLESIEKALEE